MERKKRSYLILCLVLIFGLISALIWYYFLTTALIYLFILSLLGLIVYWMPTNPLVEMSGWLYELERKKQREEAIKRGEKE